MKINPQIIKEALVALLLVSFAGLLQNTDMLTIFGIKPNLALAVLGTLSFFIGNFVLYLGLVFWGGILVSFGSGIDFGESALVLTVILFFFLKKILPWKTLVSDVILIAGGTFFFYLIFDWRFVFSFPFLVLGEAFYNILLGAVIFLLGERFFKYASEFRFTF